MLRRVYMEAGAGLSAATSALCGPKCAELGGEAVQDFLSPQRIGPARRAAARGARGVRQHDRAGVAPSSAAPIPLGRRQPVRLWDHRAPLPAARLLS